MTPEAWASLASVVCKYLEYNHYYGFWQVNLLSHGHGLNLNQTVSQHKNKLHSTTDLRAKGNWLSVDPWARFGFGKKKNYEQSNI